MHPLTNWQAHLASLNLIRSPLADESRKALRAMAAERGIILNVSRGEWSYSTPSENGYQRSAAIYRSERAALIAALDLIGGLDNESKEYHTNT